MNNYTITFKVGGGVAYADRVVKADQYDTQGDFVHFWVSTESESIASFAADVIFSIVKDSSSTVPTSKTTLGNYEEHQLPDGLRLPTK